MTYIIYLILNILFNPILKLENFKGLANTNNLWVEIYNPMSFKLKGTGKINLDFNYKNKPPNLNFNGLNSQKNLYTAKKQSTF